MNKYFLLLSLAVLMAPTIARSEEGTEVSTADTANQTKLQKYGKANYLMWMTGPRTEALSGNKDGTGTNIDVKHYFTVGGKLSENVTLLGTQLFTQHYNPKTEAEQKHAEFADPYLTLTHSKLLNSERYGANLEGYLRFYFPFSRKSRDGYNTGYLTDDGGPNDYGNGMIRLYLNPTKTFLDGKLTLSAATYLNYKIARLSTEERMQRQQAELDKTGGSGEVKDYRENMYVYFDPTVTYSVSSKVDAYLEYTPGYIRHSTNGKWTGVRHPDDGQYFSPGVNWAAAKNLNVNPYISWGPIFQGLTKADIGLQVQYTFL